MIGPPFRRKAQQDLDDVAEPDIGIGCRPLTRRRRQRDFGQQRQRHCNDCGIGLENAAVVAASGNPSACLVDRGYRRAEMDRGAVPAAFRSEILDQRAIASRNPPVLTLVPGRPLIAQREGAGAARVGRVIALDGPRDRPPQPIVLPVGKMPLQEIGNRQIGFHRAQGPVKPILMRDRMVVGQ